MYMRDSATFLLVHFYAMSSALVNDPKTAADLGNALPFRLGFSLLWTGWDPAAPKATGLWLEAPSIEGLTRPIREEFVSGTRLGIRRRGRFHQLWGCCERPRCVTVMLPSVWGDAGGTGTEGPNSQRGSSSPGPARPRGVRPGKPTGMLPKGAWTGAH